MADSFVLRNDGSYVLRNDGSRILRNNDVSGVDIQGTHATQLIGSITPRPKKRIRLNTLKAIARIIISNRGFTASARTQRQLESFHITAKVTRIAESTASSRVSRLTKDMTTEAMTFARDAKKAEVYERSTKAYNSLREQKLQKIRDLIDNLEDL